MTAGGESQRWGPGDRFRSGWPAKEREISHHETEKDREWENLRQALVADGGFFDARGNITPEGRARLLASHWKDSQIFAMQELQRSHAGGVEVIRPPEASGRYKGATQDVDVVDKGMAVARALEKDRGGRRDAGTMAFHKALAEGFDRDTAEEKRRRAEEDFDFARALGAGQSL